MRIRPGSAARSILHAALVAGASLFVGACASDILVELPEYPHEVKQSRVLDIQVTRDETHITFTNTTARSIPACRMWVNRWWGCDFPGMAVGETVTLDLRDFKDKFGDEFRAGGFFATEMPAALVHAQFEIEGEIVGLVVIGGT